MGVREGGSYVAEGKGEPRLVDQTNQPDAHRLEPTTRAPEVPTAPAAPADTSSAQFRRPGGSDPKPQE